MRRPDFFFEYFATLSSPSKSYPLFSFSQSSLLFATFHPKHISPISSPSFQNPKPNTYHQGCIRKIFQRMDRPVVEPKNLPSPQFYSSSVHSLYLPIFYVKMSTIPLATRNTPPTTFFRRETHRHFYTLQNLDGRQGFFWLAWKC